MPTASTRWDGNVISPGPIALLAIEPAQGDAPEQWSLLAASSRSAGIVSINLSEVLPFLERHSEGLFVSKNIASLHGPLCLALGSLDKPGGRAAQDVLWALTREGRWVDMRLLDRQIRFVCGEFDFKLRNWDDIVAAWQEAIAKEHRGTAEHPIASIAVPSQQDEFSQVMAVYSWLQTQADQLVAEARPVPAPDLGLPPLSAEEVESMNANLTRALNNWKKRTNYTEPAIPTNRGPVSPEEDAPRPPAQTPQSESTPHIHQLDVWAAVGFARDQLPGLTVDPARLADLRDEAMAEYGRASAVLYQNQNVRSCFEWSGEVVSRNRKGFPTVRDKRLKHWLREAFKGLCDNQNQPADVPRDANGYPSLNPEHWGFWAACDVHLWAWRQVSRMADLARIADSGAVVPHFETVPHFQSLGPNLTVYRSMGIPVFRPRPGCLFVTLKLRDLQTRCLTAVSLRRGYVSNQAARLYHYVLQQRESLEVAASELYANEMIQGTGTDVRHDEYHKAKFHFASLRDTDSDQYQVWLELTNALLETTPLGLPGIFHTVLLRNEYNLDLTESDVLRLRNNLVENVAFELRSFLEDGTLDLVTSRLGLTANEGLRRLMNPEFVEVTGPTLLNQLRGRRWRMPVMNQYRQRGSESAPAPHPPFQKSRQELIESRAITLAGRVTRRMKSTAVRRQEVLMAVDEVMLAVAHDLRAAGYALMGVAKDEFLLEVPLGPDEAIIDRIATTAQQASRRLLRDLGPPIAVDINDEW